MTTYKLLIDFKDWKKGYTFIFNDKSKYWTINEVGLIPSPVLNGRIQTLLELGHLEKVTNRWKPTNGMNYYAIYTSGGVSTICWDGGYIDKNTFSFGNVFQTKEQAEEAARRVKETLLKYQEELYD